MKKIRTPKEDIKWFELFFDIIFVTGISQIIGLLTNEIDSLTFFNVFEFVIMIILLFNLWIKVVMVENRMKIIERDFNKVITGYKIPFFVQFFLIILLIHFFMLISNGQTDQLFNFFVCYLLILISNSFIYTRKPMRIIIMLALCAIAFFTSYDILSAFLFGGFIIHQSLYTFNNLNTLSNEIFNKHLIKIVDRESEEHIDLASTDYAYDKIYVPHVFERLGIIMIVFIAEYFILLLKVMEKLDHDVMLVAFVSFILFGLFYYEFFSILEFYEHKMDVMTKKVRCYKLTKQTIYLIIFHYISVAAFAFLIGNVYKTEYIENILAIGMIGLVCYELATISLFVLQGEFERCELVKYIPIKLVTYALVYYMFSLGSTIIFLIAICINLAVGLVLNKRYTDVKFGLM